MTPYYEIESFRNVYLEDSYVLDIRTGKNVVIDVDVVLREDHPEFVQPDGNTQYCYRRGQIAFPNVNRYHLTRSELRPAFDESGEEDLGNIDEFNKTDSGFCLSGDWGELEIVGHAVKLKLNNTDL